mmetsp:Transcript_19408/g.51307  ORF Transcript_19408/g.51307 Transcript_19408/m.51307 type:complete len:224 (+) Transcript_19408:1903-2574(+)
MHELVHADGRLPGVDLDSVCGHNVRGRERLAEAVGHLVPAPRAPVRLALRGCRLARSALMVTTDVKAVHLHAAALGRRRLALVDGPVLHAGHAPLEHGLQLVHLLRAYGLRRAEDEPIHGLRARRRRHAAVVEVGRALQGALHVRRDVDGARRVPHGEALVQRAALGVEAEAAENLADAAVGDPVHRAHDHTPLQSIGHTTRLVDDHHLGVKYAPVDLVDAGR